MFVNSNVRYAVVFTLTLVACVVATGFLFAASDATTIVVGLGADPRTLGPTATDNDSCVSFRVHSTLITTNGDWEPVPDLAQSWDISKDYLTYTFYLNPAARFHDGDPVTSEDVRFSILEVDKELCSLTQRALIPSIESVETPDEHTVIFHLKNPYPEMLDHMYGLGAHCYILKKADYEGTDYFTNPRSFEPNGSGPFKFVEWVKGSHIVLERWEDYWGDKPAIERVVYRIIPDPVAMAVAFEKGEVDWVPYQLTPSQVKSLNSLPGKEAAFHGYPCGGTSNIQFNLRRELFQDIKVRRAFAAAINREKIAELAYFGGAIPAESFISKSPFTEWWFNPRAKQPPYDPEKAGTLLDEAGYPVLEGGWRFHITLLTNNFIIGNEDAAQLVKGDLAKVRINAEVVVHEYAAWVDRAFVTCDFDVDLTPFCSGPCPISLGWFTTDNIQPAPWTNNGAFSNEEYDTLHDRMISEGDQEKRKADLYRMQEILVEEQPLVYLIHRLSASAWNSNKFVGDAFWRKGLGYLFMRFTAVQPAEN